MQNQVSDDVITGISRVLVTQFAPQEVPLFRATSAAWLRDPASLTKPSTHAEDPLAFGPGEAVQFLTPVILTVVSAVVSMLATELVSKARARTQAEASQAVNITFTQGQAIQHGTAPPLTQRARLRMAFGQAFNLNELQAICFDMAIDYENLAGDTKDMKTISLLLFCERMKRLPELILYCQQLHPERAADFAGSHASALTADAVASARVAAFDQARQMNLAADKANGLADAIVTNLALA